jgi:hypothetical protein
MLDHFRTGICIDRILAGAIFLPFRALDVTNSDSVASGPSGGQFRDTRSPLALDYPHPARAGSAQQERKSMSKGTDRKKEVKKKPAKSLMEKRAAKADKRDQKKHSSPV